MTFEIIKKIKGNEYRYLVRGVREGKKVRHKFVKYLGPVKPVNRTQKKKPLGRKHSAFVRDLAPEEKHELRQAKRNNDAFIRDRAKAILLSNEGKNLNEISEKLQIHYLTIRRFIGQFDKSGLEILKRKTGGGRPKRITEDQIKDLIETANKIPRDMNLPYSNWTCKMLSKWFSEKYKQELSSEWIRVLLRRNGITYTVPKHKLMKADETLRNAFKKN